MDLSKVSKGAQIFIGAGFVYLIASFLPWYSFDVPAELQGLVQNTSFSAWSDAVSFFSGSLWALLFLAGAVILALPAFGVKAPKIPALAFLAVGALGTVFTLLKLLIGEEGLSASFGIYLAVLAAVGTTFGAFLMFKESGGELSHLTDMDKLKGHAGIQTAGSGTPPPPPPPGATPPPPPPPPPPAG